VWSPGTFDFAADGKSPSQEYIKPIDTKKRGINNILINFTILNF
jgi:hypothetical protein